MSRPVTLETIERANELLKLQPNLSEAKLAKAIGVSTGTAHKIKSAWKNTQVGTTPSSVSVATPPKYPVEHILAYWYSFNLGLELPVSEAIYWLDSYQGDTAKVKREMDNIARLVRLPNTPLPDYVGRRQAASKTA